MTRNFTPHDDERAVSVAVNHVLAIGITTILITALLFGAGNVLGQQSDRATQNQLRTIGDRIANQVSTAESMAQRRGGSVVLETNHPDAIVGSAYTVELVPGSDCPDVSASACLRLTTSDGTSDTTPVALSGPVVRSSVSGGSFAIVYDSNGAQLVASPDDASVDAGLPAPDDQPAVDPIGGAVGETRTQYGAGGGGGGGGSAPSVTVTDLRYTDCTGSGKVKEVEVDFEPDDAGNDLSTGEVRVYRTDTGDLVDSVNVTLTGDEGTTQTVTLNNFSNVDSDFRAEVTVEDDAGNTATDDMTASRGCP